MSSARGRGHVWLAGIFVFVMLALTVAAAVIWLRAALRPKVEFIPVGQGLSRARPLGPNTNYVAVFNQISSRGATAQNNAAVKLLPILFRTNVAALGQHWKASQKRMGMSGPWPKAPRFQGLEHFLPTKQYDALMRLNAPLEHPWTAKQFPSVARYLASQRSALAAIRNAVRRTRLFVPVREHGKTAGDLMFARLRPLARYRGASIALDAHAMLMVGGHHYRRAVRDWHAMYRLGALVGQQPLSISNLVGVSIQRLAARSATEAVVAFPRATKLDQALSRQRWPTIANPAACLEIGQRLVAVSALNNRVLPMSPKPGRTAASAISRTADWRWLSARMNTFYRHLGNRAATDNFTAWEKSANPSAGMSPPRPVGFGRATATIYRKLIRHSISQAKTIAYIVFADRTRCRFVRIVAALALYRAAHRAFPNRLALLTPKFLKTIPLDAISGKPPVYRRTATGYCLKSAGSPAMPGATVPTVICADAKITGSAKADPGSIAMRAGR